MILSKSTIAAVALMLGASLQVEAHAAISPMLGLNRTPQRNDALRPSSGSPCGNVNIANTFDTSQTIPVKSDRTFQATITNFNAYVPALCSGTVDIRRSHKPQRRGRLPPDRRRAV